MKGKLMLYIDQYGQKFWARTVKELREAVGGGKVHKMYRDSQQRPVHVGYVIGRHWCEAFQPVRIPA